MSAMKAGVGKVAAAAAGANQQNVEQVAALMKAARRVEQNLRLDSEFKSLSELLRANAQQPTLSGHQDIDYPNMLNLSHRIPLVSSINMVPLPSEVIEQFIGMQQNCALGIFPEISRAWLSVDSSIFFWAYDNGSDMAYYDGLNETILAVHLFKPKRNVFKSHIKYLLCLVTAQEITLLGVTCSNSSYYDNDLHNNTTATDYQNNSSTQQHTTTNGHNHQQNTSNPTLDTVLLIPDPVFKLSTDNVTLSVLAGTDNGRIFLAGNDGCLYEVVYQAEEGWFSRKCRKVNHSYSLLSYVTPAFLNFSETEPIVQIEVDSSRHLLFARTDKNTIQLYDLGVDGNSIRLVTSKTLSAIVNQASCITRTIDASNFKPIVGIKALSNSESANIHLVAVTQAGVRLYFSACGGHRPTSLDLVHVRLPPGFIPSSAMQRPNLVNNIYYKDNTFIMTSSQSDNKDFLWLFNNDFYVYEERVMEAFSVNSLGGRVWCIAEEIKPSISSSHESQKPPLVVRQHFEERRKFVLLTSEGVHIFYKQRPIDQLHHLLLEHQGPEAPAVRSFFQSTKLTESCLTSLILASSSNLPQELQLVEWATLAFFRYGGEPRLLNQSTYMPAMSTPIGSPIHSSSNLAPISHASPIPSHLNNGTVLESDQVDIQLSPRHDAIYLYLSRILRPIWSLKVAQIQQLEANQKCLINTATIEEISIYLKRLIELKKFLDSNIQFIDNNSQFNAIKMRIQHSEPITLERDSLSAMVKLLNRCIEVLNLYKLLYEHHFSTVCAKLPADRQSKFSQMTFADLIVFGDIMTSNIASALVRRYLDDNITTDAIGRRLHELCPSIFRQENALQAKAHEMILQSRAIIDKVDKERMMNEGVSLLKKIGVRLDLQAVCDLLHSAGAHRYIVDLCLFVAEKRDPMNLANLQQTRTMNGALEEGDERSAALSNRMDCYMKIIDTLDRLQTNENFNEVFESCVRSNDELFHTKLYEWLCEKNLSTRLLEVQSPYVESFLKKKAASDTFSTNYYDLLWRFYERRGNFAKAAVILEELANKPCTDYGLDERLEYLSRAKGCVEALPTPGEFLNELEERMEVVRIQLQVYKKMKELPDVPHIQEAASQLNYSLLDLTQLYQNYAQKFNLYDCQLAILKCGNHHDPTLIERLWKSIIDELLSNNAQESPDTIIHILSNKVESLGKTLMPSERFFPLYYIISYLEFKTHSYNNLLWVPNCLMKVGFKPINLLDPYHRFYKSREHSVYWAEKSIHVLQVIALLIDNSLNQTDKAFATACLDVICDYLIDLQTMSTSDCYVKRLQDNFTILQSRIKQLLN